MTISVIIPTYNRLELLKQALQSLYAQDDSDFSIIVVDDASTDGTERWMREEIKRDARIAYLRQEKNGGVNTARNRAIRETSADWVAFLDDDDTFYPHAIRTMKVWIEKIGNTADVMYFNTTHRRDSGEFVGGYQFGPGEQVYYPSYEDTLLKKGLKGDCKPVIRVGAIKRKYTFPEIVNGFESIFYAQIAREGVPIVYVNEVLTLVSFTGTDHLSFTAPKKNPEIYFELLKTFIVDHPILKKHPRTLSEKYIHIAKIAFRLKKPVAVFYLMKAVWYRLVPSKA